MTEISASEVRVLIAQAPSRREFTVRDEHGKLWRTLLQHELETLAEARIGHGNKARPYIAGMVNKFGLRWIKLLVPPRLAQKLLRKKLIGPTATVAEDNRTTERVFVAGGGILYSHRRDISYIWKRRLNDFGAKGIKNRAAVVIPRLDH
jgi:hypothetical protein